MFRRIPPRCVQAVSDSDAYNLLEKQLEAMARVEASPTASVKNLQLRLRYHRILNRRLARSQSIAIGSGFRSR